MIRYRPGVVPHPAALSAGRPCWTVMLGRHGLAVTGDPTTTGVIDVRDLDEAAELAALAWSAREGKRIEPRDVTLLVVLAHPEDYDQS